MGTITGFLGLYTRQQQSIALCFPRISTNILCVFSTNTTNHDFLSCLISNTLMHEYR